MYYTHLVDKDVFLSITTLDESVAIAYIEPLHSSSDLVR